MSNLHFINQLINILFQIANEQPPSPEVWGAILGCFIGFTLFVLFIVVTTVFSDQLLFIIRKFNK